MHSGRWNEHWMGLDNLKRLNNRQANEYEKGVVLRSQRTGEHSMPSIVAKTVRN